MPRREIKRALAEDRLSQKDIEHARNIFAKYGEFKSWIYRLDVSTLSKLQKIHVRMESKNRLAAPKIEALAEEVAKYYTKPEPPDPLDGLELSRDVQILGGSLYKFLAWHEKHVHNKGESKRKVVNRYLAHLINEKEI